MPDWRGLLDMSLAYYKEINMTLPSRVTTLDLPALYRNSVGIDRLVDSMMSLADRTPVGYPPYNVISMDDNNYMIEIACSGFTDKDIKVVVNNGDLRITGERTKEVEETSPVNEGKAHKGTVVQNEVKYLHLGISTRKWERTFTLADYVEVKDASITDGMLRIKLERIIPEAMKPRQIPGKNK